MDLDPERCAAIVERGDARFDGWLYVGVTSTGIYCRPSCPARTPKRSNMTFHPSAAAAQRYGFRACKRCRPDAAPGSPDWDTRADAVGRALRLIADGVVDRDGVGGLARRLGYSERHLGRLLTDEVGAGPLALARAQRARTARVLLETTDLPVSEVAFASGFDSVRQFNDTIRATFSAPPSELRARSGRAATMPHDAAIGMRLAVRQPFDRIGLAGFLAARAVSGVETVDHLTVTRALSLPGGPAVAELALAVDHVDARFHLTDLADLAAAIARCRRLLDLDADPEAVDATLGGAPSLTSSVRAHPGRRVPGAVDGWELAARAVVGQQVSVAGARALLGRSWRPTVRPWPIRWGPSPGSSPTPPRPQGSTRPHCPFLRPGPGRSSTWPPRSPRGAWCSTPAPTGMRRPPASVACGGSGDGPRTTCGCVPWATPMCCWTATS